MRNNHYLCIEASSWLSISFQTKHNEQNEILYKNFSFEEGGWGGGGVV